MIAREEMPLGPHVSVLSQRPGDHSFSFPWVRHLNEPSPKAQQLPNCGHRLPGLSACKGRSRGPQLDASLDLFSVARLEEDKTKQKQNHCGLNSKVRKDPGRPSVYTARAKDGGMMGGSWVQY